MWPPATRRQHSRAGLRYETELTDAKWPLVAPFSPLFISPELEKWIDRLVEEVSDDQTFAAIKAVEF